jgi:hypothetical protein
LIQDQDLQIVENLPKEPLAVILTGRPSRKEQQISEINLNLEAVVSAVDSTVGLPGKKVVSKVVPELSSRVQCDPSRVCDSHLFISFFLFPKLESEQRLK